MKQTITTSICSLSWIDERTGLPEHDKSGPAARIPGRLITKEGDTLPYRFLNLLEASITVDGGRILSYAFSDASKIYRNPSFLQINSEPFATSKRVDRGSDCVVFEQTAGARTVSPEVIGQVVGIISGAPWGDKIGRSAAHALQGFPPIWTRLQLKIYRDGRSEGQVLCYSLFPSMSFYQLTAAAGAAAGRGGILGATRETSFYDQDGSTYDARPNLDRWKTDGWGALQTNPLGACKGNPWGLSKGDLTVRPVNRNTAVI